MSKPKVTQLEDAWSFAYDGFTQTVPFSVTEDKKEAQEIAETSYQTWLERQSQTEAK